MNAKLSSYHKLLLRWFYQITLFFLVRLNNRLSGFSFNKQYLFDNLRIINLIFINRLSFNSTFFYRFNLYSAFSNYMYSRLIFILICPICNYLLSWFIRKCHFNTWFVRLFASVWFQRNSWWVLIMNNFLWAIKFIFLGWHWKRTSNLGGFDINLSFYQRHHINRSSYFLFCYITPIVYLLAFTNFLKFPFTNQSTNFLWRIWFFRYILAFVIGFNFENCYTLFRYPLFLLIIFHIVFISIILCFWSEVTEISFTVTFIRFI